MTTLPPADSLALAPLENYGGALTVDSLDLSASPTTLTAAFPTLQSTSRIGRNEPMQKRRTDALAIGASAISKPFLMSALAPSRRLVRIVFPGTFQVLDRTLATVESIPSASHSSAGFRVQKVNYLELLRSLQDLRSNCADAFRLEGTRPPQLPSWGNDCDILDLYNQNDFEILGVCFRAEVENFLVQLDRASASLMRDSPRMSSTPTPVISPDSPAPRAVSAQGFIYDKLPARRTPAPVSRVRTSGHRSVKSRGSADTFIATTTRLSPEPRRFPSHSTSNPDHCCGSTDTSTFDSSSPSHSAATSLQTTHHSASTRSSSHYPNILYTLPRSSHIENPSARTEQPTYPASTVPVRQGSFHNGLRVREIQAPTSLSSRAYSARNAYKAPIEQPDSSSDSDDDRRALLPSTVSSHSTISRHRSYYNDSDGSDDLAHHYYDHSNVNSGHLGSRHSDDEPADHDSDPDFSGVNSEHFESADSDLAPAYHNSSGPADSDHSDSYPSDADLAPAYHNDSGPADYDHSDSYPSDADLAYHDNDSDYDESDCASLSSAGSNYYSEESFNSDSH